MMEKPNIFLNLLISGSVQLEVHLMPATSRFEVSENGNLVVSGKNFFLSAFMYSANAENQGVKLCVSLLFQVKLASLRTTIFSHSKSL